MEGAKITLDDVYKDFVKHEHINMQKIFAHKIEEQLNESWFERLLKIAYEKGREDGFESGYNTGYDFGFDFAQSFYMEEGDENDMYD